MESRDTSYGNKSLEARLSWQADNGFLSGANPDLGRTSFILAGRKSKGSLECLAESGVGIVANRFRHFEQFPFPLAQERRCFVHSPVRRLRAKPDKIVVDVYAAIPSS
jgi:hypothetical protein